MIVFGDSLTDTKNLASITDGKSELYYSQKYNIRRMIDLYVHQVPPNEVQYDGRFTDGQNWVDQFSKTQGIEVINYAVGGSSMHNYKTPFREDIGMWGLYDLSKSIFEQWTMFKKDVEENKIEFDPEDLVYFMGGGNDLMIYQDVAKPAQMAEDMAWFTKQAKGQGYTKVLVGNLPYLPQTPYYALNAERQPEMDTKIREYNRFLEMSIASVNIYHSEFQSSDHDVNKHSIEIYDLTTFVQNLDKQWSDVSTISIPCFYGAATINRGQQFNYFNNKFRVRTDSEENEYFEQFHQIIKTGTADKKFQNKFSNTRCSHEHTYKYMFQDDLHPMSHGFRLIAIDFNRFIKSTQIGSGLPDQELIDIFTSPIPYIYYTQEITNIDDINSKSKIEYYKKRKKEQLANLFTTEDDMETILTGYMSEENLNLKYQNLDSVDVELNQLLDSVVTIGE